MSADTSTIRSNGGLQSAISPGQHPKAAVEECLSNIPFFKPAISDAEISAVTQVLRSGWLTTGPNCRNFEQKFAELIHEDVEAVAVSSATAGLHLAAEACGIGPGDQVLVPTLTFTATAAVLRYLGADVILVDIDEKTRTIDLDHAEQLVTPRC
ncbi:MAG: aminotransferase class I/II-fold pyridoxal phosphate-dependent enzyme, partial [Hyphomicrobiales bacterium]|nr:aminotransferase class I/II-fold pyridoxal phosphate-dependent enzyme [Hyphomicrobiales bacterium]